VVFVRSQNVTFEGLVLDDIAFLDVKTHKQMERSEVFARDVLINITGASIGRCCPVPKGLGLTNVNQHVCAIRIPNPCREDALFLSSVLASNIGQHQIDVLNAGGNREGLNYQQLRSFIIPWPEKAERHRIAGIIDAHDSRIRAEERYLEKLKLQKKGLMHDLLTGKARVKMEKSSEAAS
jgi:type I restriction enzyme S subunit